MLNPDEKMFHCSAKIGVQQLTSRVSVFDFEAQHSSRTFLIASLAKTATWKIASRWLIAMGQVFVVALDGIARVDDGW